MARAVVVFQECVQDSQDYGRNDEHMISRVFFTLELSEGGPIAFYSEIKQAVGSSFETGAIEVSPPQHRETNAEYTGLLNYNAFRDCVERYNRGCVGAKGAGIRIGGGTNIRMRNNRFIRQERCEFEV